MKHIIKESTETYLTALQHHTFPGSKYGNQQRMEAAVNYMVTGSLTKTAKACDIPLTTLFDWKQSDWWYELSEWIRSEKEDEFRAGFTEIVDLAIENVKDRLKNGDIKLVKTKDGYEERRVPVGAKDSTMVAAISYDKLRLSENKATSIQSNESAGGIQARLEEFARQVLEQRRQAEAKVVSDQKKEK